MKKNNQTNITENTEIQTNKKWKILTESVSFCIIFMFIHKKC